MTYIYRKIVQFVLLFAIGPLCHFSESLCIASAVVLRVTLEIWPQTFIFSASSTVTFTSLRVASKKSPPSAPSTLGITPGLNTGAVYPQYFPFVLACKAFALTSVHAASKEVWVFAR
jgi:hypothetical protein